VVVDFTETVKVTTCPTIACVGSTLADVTKPADDNTPAPTLLSPRVTSGRLIASKGAVSARLRRRLKLDADTEFLTFSGRNCPARISSMSAFMKP
jgi:hypothetical protein